MTTLMMAAKETKHHAHKQFFLGSFAQHIIPKNDLGT